MAIELVKRETYLLGGGSANVDLSNYATKTYVDNAIENIDVDLTGYATEEYVNKAIANVEISSGCLLTFETITIGEDSGNVPVSGITLDYNSISLNPGDNMMLAASISPSNATNNIVLWKSSNNEVATVNNGLVVAVASGNAVITAYSQEDNNIKATCNVVVEAESGEVKIQLGSLEMNTGLLKKDGITVVSTITNTYYVELPYIESMFISTAFNPGWVGNYPPFMVNVNDVITIPEYTQSDTVAGANVAGKLYTTTLTGFSSTAKVYVNIYAAAKGNSTLEEAMNSADVYYYSYTK